MFVVFEPILTVKEMLGHSTLYGQVFDTGFSPFLLSPPYLGFVVGRTTTTLGMIVPTIATVSNHFGISLSVKKSFRIKAISDYFGFYPK